MGLSVLFTSTRRHDTPGLSLPVREVSIVVNDDVISLTGSLGSNNFLRGDNLSSERSLVLVHVHGNSGLIKVRLGLKEVLLASDSGAACEKREEKMRIMTWVILTMPTFLRTLLKDFKR
jgi:hypothetical protein